MARRRRNRNSLSTLARVDFPVVRRYPRLRSALQLIEDRRVFHPEGALRSPLSIGIPRKSRIVLRKANFGKTLPSRLGFAVPEKVVRCVRRKQRKEVLIAKRRSGRGSAKRFDFWSDVSC